MPSWFDSLKRSFWTPLILIIKTRRNSKHEQLDQLPPYLFTKDTIKFKQPINVLNVTLLVEDIKLAKILPLLKEPEQIFLIEKFIFNKTDKRNWKGSGYYKTGCDKFKTSTLQKFKNAGLISA